MDLRRNGQDSPDGDIPAAASGRSTSESRPHLASDSLLLAGQDWPSIVLVLAVVVALVRLGHFRSPLDIGMEEE